MERGRNRMNRMKSIRVNAFDSIMFKSFNGLKQEENKDSNDFQKKTTEERI